jgi:diguanylate cyclase (GGDEF)-like protein/PAS domain S-box-containing protein
MPNETKLAEAAPARAARPIAAARQPRRRRFGLVMVAALLVAAGTAQTIAALRGGADQSRDAATVVARLDAQVQRQTAIRWQATAPGASALELGRALRATGEEIAGLFQVLESVERASFGLRGVTLAAQGYQTALEEQIAAVGVDPTRAAQLERTRVAPAYDAFIRARDSAATRLEASAASTAMAADLGTLASLLSAAVLICLLFRKWERARRRGAFIDGEAAGVRLSEARFRSLVQHSSDLISVIGQDGRVVYASPSIEQLLGSSETLVGMSIAEMVHPEDIAAVEALFAEQGVDAGSQTVEWRMRHTSGEWRTFENIARRGQGSMNGTLIINSRDVTERIRLEGALRHQANHDPLTGLGNRILLVDGLQRAVARTRRNGGATALLLLDLDDFKGVNDSLGHAAGDQLLIAIAERLRSAVRADSLVARIGGDEFAIVVEDLDVPARARDVAARVQGSLSEPIALGDRLVPASASIGIATSMDGTPDVAMLLRQADIAMYAAKRRGRGEYETFQPTMHDAALERLELETDLRRAVAAGEFVPHYQAILDLRHGTIVGFEALVRWAHPTKGLLSPAAFLPLAEQTGLIAEIGGRVLREATAQMAAWNADPNIGGDRWMSVNLAPRQLTAPGIVDEVRLALGDAGLSADRLILELTENSVMSDPEAAARTLGALRTLGLRLAIDDFGTGYSSLGHLQRFPFDVLKVDRSFVAELAGPASGNALAPTIVDLARRLGLTSIAEGIERQDQLELLRDLGCEFGQGFLLHRPASAKAVTERLRAIADPGRAPRPSAIRWSPTS